jgi:hypothetical protein
MENFQANFQNYHETKIKEKRHEPTSEEIRKLQTN